MGVMIIPMISSLSEDAIYAVPDAVREAALGLGAGKVPAIVRVIVPSAWSGIAAAMTLAVSRAIGETMIVALAAGAGPNFTFNPFVAANSTAEELAARPPAVGETPAGGLGAPAGKVTVSLGQYGEKVTVPEEAKKKLS